MRTFLTTTAAIGLLALSPVNAQTVQPSDRDSSSGELNVLSTDASPSSAMIQGFDSYEERDDFSGQIVGGHAHDDLIGADVVNADGDSLGEIEDIGIDASGRATHAMVDVSGFLELDDHVVAIDLNDLSMGEGDAADDEFVLNASDDELERKTDYELEDGRWVVETDD